MSKGAVAELRWLGLCESDNADISAVRTVMEKVLPKQGRLYFCVPCGIDSPAKVESYFSFLLRFVRPKAIVLNSDVKMFPTFQHFNAFLQCVSYVGKLDLNALYIVEQHYDKKIVRENQFGWYTKPYVWSEDKESDDT